jgi:class 3 adenylate cyclase/pimeloyl-ACP methyl ester carboxylesterase
MERRLAAILAADVAGYSRMMSVDEAATLATLQLHQSELLSPAITRHRGRIVKLMGDGILAEFGSVVEAVRCAIEIQREMAVRNRTTNGAQRMTFRIGAHVGDVIADNDDIYGDGVNIAARLEGLAEPGSICISRQAYDQIDGKIPNVFRSLGPQQLKNIPKAVEVFAIESDELDGPRSIAGADPARLQQEISYCRAPDGVRLAWAKVGQGPPLVRTGAWMSHLEYEWDNPLRRASVLNLAKNHTLIRYDPRGNGLSDWDVADISLDAWVSDLEAVVDAAGLTRFPLLAVSQGCAIAISYIVRHPERISRLVLYGGFALGGNKRSEQEKNKRTAMATLMRMGWGNDEPSFRQLFTSQMMPGAAKEQSDAFNELQRRTTSPECAARYFAAVGDFDVVDLLPKIKVPTLVMHARGDLMQPFEEGRRMAAAIADARFVALQGQNHFFLPGEPAGQRFLEELELFLAE